MSAQFGTVHADRGPSIRVSGSWSGGWVLLAMQDSEIAPSHTVKARFNKEDARDLIANLKQAFEYAYGEEP